VASLLAVAEAMGDEAWEVGNPDVSNAVLIYQDAAGKVQALRWIRGSDRGFAEAVMRTGAQMLDAPAAKN
jgi:hypothetical protein